MSTHSPFTSGATFSHLELSEEIPETRRNYIKAFNTLDNGLKVLLEAVDTDSLMRHATLVITGDHVIFDEPTFCPLIIYSPKINARKIYSKECYQMDIYPTLLDLFGIEAKWEGFGISLLSGEEREFDETQAYALSDEILRANYFAKYTNHHKSRHYVAHAGGMIDGFMYTNSLEAVDNAIANGIHYIELDLALTKEDSLVASQDF